MNTVIFITKENKEEMAESIRRLAADQENKINGALIVCHQSVVSTKEAEKIARPLIEKYATSAAIKTSSNLTISHDGQIAVMFARFVALAYIRYPGPWLVIDAPVKPTSPDWVSLISKQHVLFGGKVTGHAVKDGKSLLTKGPLTIQLPGKVMRMLHFATNESWRSRGRYLLMGSGLKVVPDESSVFQLLSANPPQKSKLTNAIINDVFEKLGGEKAILSGTDETQPPLAVTAIEILAADEAVEKDQLIKKIEKYTGKKPHHFTGIDKLREMVQSLDQPQSV